MIEVNLHEAKTDLSRLLQRIAAGGEVIIARAGIHFARLVPFFDSLLRPWLCVEEVGTIRRSSQCWKEYRLRPTL
jgi:antitoxin (DNA-binding transcriptional repressor) of toxin-antitoxin stability system